MIKRRRPGTALPRRGAITIVMLVLTMIVAMVMAASFLIGRAITARLELQTTTDAVARAAALVAQEQGTGAANRPVAYTPVVLANSARNLAAPIAVIALDDPNGDWLHINAELRTQVGTDSTGLTGDIAVIDVTTRARVRVHQQIFDDVERIVPKMVLVLDYSHSMDEGFGGSNRITALRDGVNGLLDLGLEIDYALVRYCTTVKQVVNFAAGNEGQIRAALGGRTCGETATGEALQRARLMLQGQPDDERFVLLVSDGVPTSLVPPVPVADDLRTNQQTSVFSMQIIAPGAGLLELIMRRLAGPVDDDNGNDPDYFVAVGNAGVMVAMFQNITSEIQCRTAPLNPPPQQKADGTYRVFGFMRAGGGAEEESLVFYEPDTGTVLVTEAAHCDRIRDGTDELVVRYDYPKLVL